MSETGTKKTGVRERWSSVLKRYILLCVGLLIMAFGVVFSIIGNLGTSPISSLPYVASLLVPLTVGQTTIVLHCILILLQILILRKQYGWIQLMQLPAAFLFGFMTDFAENLLRNVTATSYGIQWLYCAIGIVLVAIGVSCEVVAGVVTLAGEGFVLALCKAFGFAFAKTKVAFDVSLVALACALSFLCLHSLQGVREGTLAAAVLVGVCSRQINRPLGRLVEKVIS